MKLRLLGLVAVVSVFLFVSTASAERFSLESDLSKTFKKTSSVVERAIAKLENGKKVDAEISQLQSVFESITAIDLLYRGRLESQVEKAAEVGGLAVERQAQLFQHYTGSIQALFSSFEATLAPDGFNQSNLHQIQDLIRTFLPHKDRPIHGLLPYQHLDYPQVLPATSPAVTPAYKVAGSTVTNADTEGSPEAPVSATIAAKAEALGWSPVAIYEWVKNNVKTEWYWGAMKGAEETLLQLSGNDADQAALLVAMLRASGYPSRYVHGVIEFFPEDVQTVIEQTGVTDFAQVGELFRRAGIPYQAVNGDSNYRIEHIWVETKVPYANYRGSVSDLQGEAWIPLDTSLKVTGYIDAGPTVDLVLDTDPSNPLPTARDAYLGTVQTLTPVGQLQQDTQAFLDTNYPGQLYADTLATRTQASESLNILPGSPQFKEIAVTAEYTALPDTLLHQVQFTATLTDTTPVFSVSMRAHELSNKKIIVSYEPETVEDQEIINSWGGLANTPAYLVRLRPVLMVDDSRIVVGKEGLAFGETFSLQVTINTPNGPVGYTNVVETGYPQAIGFVAQNAIVPDPVTVDQAAESLMHHTTLQYIDQWNNSEEELGNLLQVAVVRPIPTMTTVGGMLEIVAPLGVPQGVIWKGLFVDADLRAVEAINRTLIDDDREKSFMQLSALEGSELEARVFEDPNGLYGASGGVESISTAELFGLANDQSVTIHTIDAANVDSLLPTLGLAANITVDIDDAVRNQDQTVQVPALDITHGIWTGTGYIKENLATGEAGYMLSGALAGSSTVMGIEVWPPEVSSTLQGPFGVEPNRNPEAAKYIYKIQPTALRIATAGETLSDRLMVLVLDETRVPVRDAEVVFSVQAAGRLIDESFPGVESDELTVLTDDLGIARVRFKAGESINAATQMGYLRQGDTYANNVGLNFIDAQLTVSDPETPIPPSLNPPFTVVVFAGEPDRANVEVHGDGVDYGSLYRQSINATVILNDKYGNRVANWPVNFTALLAEPKNGSLCTDIASYAPANKAELIDQYDSCLLDIPLYGECPTANNTFLLQSASFGNSSVEVILGGVPNADYPIQISYTTAIDGLITETIRQSASTPSSCTSEYAPHRRLWFDFNEYDYGRPAGVPTTVDFKAYLLAEGEEIKNDGETLTCGEGENEETITCNQVVGDGHFTITAPTEVKAEGQHVDPIPGLNVVTGLYRYNGTLPLGAQFIHVEAATEIEGLEFNHNCPECDTEAEMVTQSVSPISADISISGVSVTVPNDFILVPIDVNGYSTQPVNVDYLIQPDDYTASLAQVLIFHGDILEAAYLPSSGVYSGNGFITIPTGYWFDRGAGYTAKVKINGSDDPDTIYSRAVPIRFGNTRDDGNPTGVVRNYQTGEFGDPVPVAQSPYIDKWGEFEFSLDNTAMVKVTLLSSDLETETIIVAETELLAGDHKFLVTYDQVAEAGVSAFTDPKYYIQLEQNINDSVHVVLYEGRQYVSTPKAKMLGQTMVHDVLIQDGSLNLSRQDIVLEGRGPQLGFSRSYNNQNSRLGFKPLGRGWSHGLDMRLTVSSTDDCGTDSVPEWVTDKKGVFFPSTYVPTPAQVYSVQVNGTQFKKVGSTWYAERSKHGRLVDISGGFKFTAKDGTAYRYDHLFKGEYFVTAIEDRNGNALTFTYDPATYRLSKVTDAAGREMTFTTEVIPGYQDDDLHRITSIAGPDEITIDFSYDAFGYLIKATRGVRSETYAYEREANISNADFNLVKATDSNGYSYQYEYHSMRFDSGLALATGFVKGQDVVKTVTYPDDRTANFTYQETNDNKRIVSDLRGNDPLKDTTYTLNPYGNPLKIEEPLDKITEMTWSIDEGGSDNVMTSMSVSVGTDLPARMAQTTYLYDSMGNITKETDPYGNFITTTWDEENYSQPLTRIDRNGVEQRWTYDPAINGCLIKHEVEVEPGVFKTTDSTCYETGEVKTVTDMLGNVIRTLYDIYGNPDLVTVADNSTDSNEKATTDFYYDVRGRKETETDPLGNQIVYTYDDLDYPATVTWPTHSSYALISGSSNVKTTTYDAEGNLLTDTDRTGLTLTYGYTKRNQVDTITRTGGSSTYGIKKFIYDDNGNLTSESDWQGIATTHTYDALNRRDSTTNRLDDSMSMAYDLAGNLIQTTDFESRVTDYEYDDLGRQTKVTQPSLPSQARGFIDYTYYNEADPKTNLKTVTDAEGHTTTFEYNGRYQKSKQINVLLDEYVWQYDDAGNLEKEIDEELNETRYVYDKQNRMRFTYKALKDEFETIIREIPIAERQYDAVGNVRFVVDAVGNTTEAIYDEWNRPWKTITPVDSHAGLSYTSTTELDGEGREVKVLDGNSHERTFLRDPRGLVLTATDAELQPTTYTYNNNDNVKTVTNALNIITSFDYDADDRKKLTTEAEGMPEERVSGVILYDKVGNPLQVQDGNGNVIITEYNKLNLPWKQYNPAPLNTQFVEILYDKNGKPVSMKNRRGFITTTHYNELGRADLITDPAPFNAQTLVTTYDKVGNARTVKDKRGIISETIYDSLYRPVEQKRDNIRIVTNEYDDAGNLSATIDAENNRVEYAFNSRNLPERTTYIDGVDDYYSEQFYDGVGSVLTSINEALKTTTYTYDNENRQKTVEFADETTENFYDAVGNLEQVLKPKLNERSMTYDGLNRLATVADGGLLTTTYSYDGNNNLRTIEDPLNNIVEYTYDALNRKTAHIQQKASGNLTVNYDLYDAEGNLTQSTDAKGQLFTYAYDELNRQTTTTYPVVTTPFMTIESVTTGYDANNNVTRIDELKQISGSGSMTDTTINIYDNFDRLKTSTQRDMPITYGYDNNGNRTSVATANRSTSYGYDTRNRLETVVAGADTTVYSYTPDSLTDTVNYPSSNGAVAKYIYYPNNRVDTITHTDSAQALISSFDYLYDANGNRTEQIEVQGGVTETTNYVYDDLDRLENFTLTSGADVTVTSYTFEGYNRKTETVTVNAATTAAKTSNYDETNWLTDLTDTVPATPVVIDYQYDNNGNTLLKTDSSKPGEDVVFDYDVANRMVQTTQGVTQLGQYDYNAQGMRVRHYGSERGDVEYFYDGGSVLEEFVAGASGGLLAHYRYGDRLLSLDAPDDGGLQYYHHDGLGSTVNLTDSVGATKVSYQLDPWGHIRNQIGSSVNRQVFTGQEHDEKTGLIYFGARYYDPDTARFMSQDSYLGEAGTPPSLHRYLYAYSNPTVYVDPNGHIGIFFDGTGNDKDNNNLAKTNIAKLHDSYSDGERIYQDGVGSDWYTKYTLGGLSGAGGSSRLDSAYSAFVKAYNAADDKDKVIDIFGFSRGAAMARAFANKIKDEGVDDHSKLVGYETISVENEEGITEFEKKPIYEKFKNVEIRFMGVFDTVASFGVPGNNVDLGYDMSIDEKFIKETRHAVALNEYRGLFDLQSVAKSEDAKLPTNVVERGFWGAHSDIGGGYKDGKGGKSNALANIPLNWMYNEARKNGVNFMPLNKSSQNIPPVGDLSGKELEEKYIHDSRSFIGRLFGDNERDVFYNEVK